MFRLNVTHHATHQITFSQKIGSIMWTITRHVSPEQRTYIMYVFSVVNRRGEMDEAMDHWIHHGTSSWGLRRRICSAITYQQQKHEQHSCHLQGDRRQDEGHHNDGRYQHGGSVYFEHLEEQEQQLNKGIWDVQSDPSCHEIPLLLWRQRCLHVPIMGAGTEFSKYIGMCLTSNNASKFYVFEILQVIPMHSLRSPKGLKIRPVNNFTGPLGSAKLTNSCKLHLQGFDCNYYVMYFIDSQFKCRY